MRFAVGMTVMVIGILSLLAGIALAIANCTGAAVVCGLIGFSLGFGATINTDTDDR